MLITGKCGFLHFGMCGNEVQRVWSDLLPAAWGMKRPVGGGEEARHGPWGRARQRVRVVRERVLGVQVLVDPQIRAYCTCKT